MLTSAARLASLRIAAVRFFLLTLLVMILAPAAAVSQTVEWSRRTGTIDADEAFGVAVEVNMVNCPRASTGVVLP